MSYLGYFNEIIITLGIVSHLENKKNMDENVGSLVK